MESLQKPDHNEYSLADRMLSKVEAAQAEGRGGEVYRIDDIIDLLDQVDENPENEKLTVPFGLLSHALRDYVEASRSNGRQIVTLANDEAASLFYTADLQIVNQSSGEIVPMTPKVTQISDSTQTFKQSA